MNKGEIYEVLKDRELHDQVEAVYDYIEELSIFKLDKAEQIIRRVKGKWLILHRLIKSMEVNSNTKIVVDMLSVIEDKITEVEDFVINNQNK